MQQTNWNKLNGILKYEVSTLGLIFQDAGGGMRNFIPPNRKAKLSCKGIVTPCKEETYVASY